MLSNINRIKSHIPQMNFLQKPFYTPVNKFSFSEYNVYKVQPQVNRPENKEDNKNEGTQDEPKESKNLTKKERFFTKKNNDIEESVKTESTTTISGGGSLKSNTFPEEFSDSNEFTSYTRDIKNQKISDEHYSKSTGPYLDSTFGGAKEGQYPYEGSSNHKFDFSAGGEETGLGRQSKYASGGSGTYINESQFKKKEADDSKNKETHDNKQEKKTESEKEKKN